MASSSRNNHKRSKKGKRKAKSSDDDIAALDNNDEELFSVEKIVDSKIDKNGVQLYKCRWKGYTAAHDTWEPTENVSSTGHVDRYKRLQCQQILKAGTPGVALIEYEDGERELVDLKVEKFRGHRDDESDDGRDDDTVDGDDDVNNFNLVVAGEWIEILWPLAHMYFSCKIISYTPIKSKKKSKKRARKKGEVVEDAKGGPTEEAKPASKKRKKENTKQLSSVTKKQKDNNMIAAPTKQAEPAKTPEPEASQQSCCLQ